MLTAENAEWSLMSMTEHYMCNKCETDSKHLFEQTVRLVFHSHHFSFRFHGVACYLGVGWRRNFENADFYQRALYTFAGNTLIGFPWMAMKNDSVTAREGKRKKGTGIRKVWNRMTERKGERKSSKQSSFCIRFAYTKFEQCYRRLQCGWLLFVWELLWAM